MIKTLDVYEVDGKRIEGRDALSKYLFKTSSKNGWGFATNGSLVKIKYIELPTNFFLYGRYEVQYPNGLTSIESEEPYGNWCHSEDFTRLGMEIVSDIASLKNDIKILETKLKFVRALQKKFEDE